MAAVGSGPAASAASAFIHLQGVTKAYAMGRETVRALDEVTLSLPEGQFAGIVGPSGSGKSTLLHLLAAMDRPTEGQIAVGDWDLSTLNRTAQARYRREMVGMIFQQFNLVNTMTACENVELPLLLAGVPPRERRAAATDKLAAVGLGDRVDHRPTELSGGEQQRVAIARALVADPPLLLADEPTGNLDSVTGGRIIDLLREIHEERGKTVVVVTHHPAEIDGVADRLIRLHDGRLASEPADRAAA